MSNEKKYKLTYFDLPGRGEVSRWLLIKGGVNFEDVRISYQQWKEDKSPFVGVTLFGQLPILEVDGVKLCQSKAIERLLAKRFGYYGENDIEQAKVDMIVDCISDILEPGIDIIFKMKDCPEKAEKTKVYFEKILPEGWQKLAKLLEENKEGGGFVGKSITWADMSFTVQSAWFEKVSINPRLPENLKCLKERVENIPEIKCFMAKYKS